MKIAVLADAANVSQEGKLNITGIFNRIRARTFPVRWPSMTLVLQFESHISEAGEHMFVIRIADDDGGEVAKIEGKFEMTPNPDQDPGLPLLSNLILPIRDAEFQRAGTYSFDVLFDGRYEGSAPLHVIQLATA